MKKIIFVGTAILLAGIGLATLSSAKTMATKKSDAPPVFSFATVAGGLFS